MRGSFDAMVISIRRDGTRERGSVGRDYSKRVSAVHGDFGSPAPIYASLRERASGRGALAPSLRRAQSLVRIALAPDRFGDRGSGATRLGLRALHRARGLLDGGAQRAQPLDLGGARA